MNNIFDKKRAEIIESFPSIFSKEDVIAILNQVESEVEAPSQNDIIESIKGEVISVIEGFYYEDIIELDLYDREIKIEVYPDRLARQVEKAINDLGS